MRGFGIIIGHVIISPFVFLKILQCMITQQLCRNFQTGLTLTFGALHGVYNTTQTKTKPKEELNQII